jgi:hypothetical protein
LAMIGGCVLAVGILAWKLCFAQPPTAAPQLAKSWHEQLYGLDEDEVLRFIPPPYSPQRMQIMARGYYKNPMPGVMGQLAFLSNRGSTYPAGIMKSPGDLKAAVEWSTIGEDREIEGDLTSISVDGDWFVRQETPGDRRAQALQSILNKATGRDLAIEKRLLPRDVLVAKGKWDFVPVRLRNGGFAQEVYLYVRDGDQFAGARDAGSGDFERFLMQIRYRSGLRVIDETEGAKPATIAWCECMWRQTPSDSAAALDQFLINLQKQTSLRFAKERRPVPGWYVRSGSSASTQPGVLP